MVAEAGWWEFPLPYHYITPEKLHAAAVPCSAPTLQQACLQVGL